MSPQRETRYFVPLPSPPAIDTGEAESLLSGHVPLNLAPPAQRDLLCRRFHERLQQASAQEISLSDIQIGEDCLPTWQSWNWDPETHSLTTIIRERLDALSLSQDLGSFLRDEIIVKCSQKLKEASELGVQVDDISLGSDLLPQWPSRPRPAVENTESFETCDSGYFSRAVGSAVSTQSSQLASTKAQTAISSPFCYSSDNDVGLSDADDADDEYDGTENQDDYDYDYDIDMGGMNHEDTILVDTAAQSSEAAHDQQSPRRTRAALNRGPSANNHTGYLTDESSTQSSISESAAPDQPLQNIVYDVELTGGREATGVLDLEVYLLDDSDAESLHELELAVNLGGSEQHYEESEGVDIEIPGFPITCTGDIELSDDSSAQEITTEEHVLLQMGLRHGWVSPSQQRRDQLGKLERLITARRPQRQVPDVLMVDWGNEGQSPMDMPTHEDLESDISEEGVTTEEEADVERKQVPPADEQEALRESSSAEVRGASEEESEESDAEFEDVL